MAIKTERISRAKSLAGYSVIELLFVIVLAAVVAGIAAPQFLVALDRQRSWAAARYLAARMAMARSYAVTRSAHVALRFIGEGSDVTFQMFFDDNHNGVRTVDIASKVDRAIGAPSLDPNITYLRLAAATDCIRAGARFIATNRDPVYPTERGLRPGAGSIAAAVEAASGVTPLSIGKPEPHLLELAAEAVGRDPRDAVMIGDGIGTDLAAARAVGARCIFMLTGVTTREQVEALPADERPTAIAADADELAAALAALSGI